MTTVPPGAGRLTTVGGDRVVLAHAVGVRSDLPVPLWAVLVAGALAVLVSFAALSAWWRTPRLRGDRAGRPLPVGPARVLDSALLRGTLRAVVLLATLGVVFVALFGPRTSAFNLSPYAFYVTFWVGLVPVSLLLGPVWRLVNPLRTIHAGLHRLTGPPPGADTLHRVGSWPAAAGLLAYAWLELVYPDRAAPRTVGVALVLYAVVQLVAAFWYGPGWFARGDGFEVWSTLLGRLSVLGRREDGRLVLRNPLDGADGTPERPGLAAVVTVLVGSTAFDGVSRTTWYLTRYGLDGDDVLTPTLGLLVTVGLVAGLYTLATLLAGRWTATPDARPATRTRSCRSPPVTPWRTTSRCWSSRGS